MFNSRKHSTGRRFEMHALTKGSFKNSTLEDDEPNSLETMPLEEKLERKAAEKEASRANATQGSNRALLVSVIVMCLISLVVLLLTLLMLFGKIGNGCGCSTDEASSSSTQSLATDSAKIKALEENISSLQLGLEKVIYHQSMTPSWLEAHASYINSNLSSTTEQLTFIASSGDYLAAILKVPLIPANVLQNSTRLTVKIVVYNDVTIEAIYDSDTRYGVSDGISFVGFETVNSDNYYSYAPCFGNEGYSGTTLTGERLISYSSPGLSDSFYPGQFVITLRLAAREIWGSCYTAHDGGFLKTAVYSKSLVLNRGLTLEAYKGQKEERVGIKFIEVAVVDDL